jgi:hypothetical protein
MRTKTHKLKRIVIESRVLLASTLTSLAILLSATASAATLVTPIKGTAPTAPKTTTSSKSNLPPAKSRQYAVGCQGGTVIVTGNTLSCSHPPAVPTVEGIGAATIPYPDGAGVTMMTVNCGSKNIIDLTIGARASFKCHGGATAKIKNHHEVHKPTHVAGSACDGSAPCSDPAACAANPSLAGCGSDANSLCTTNNCDLIEKYVNPAIDTLSVAFGLIAVISIILGGIQYSSSAGDPQKVSAAKKRITQTLFAIGAYFILFVFLQFLVPGGIFH